MTLVCDDLNPHDTAGLHRAFDADTAGEPRRRLRLVFTPRSSSWLNTAEMELSLLSRQCPGRRRFATAEAPGAAVADGRFTTTDARIKLESLYPKHDI